jgi:hypothetical protein
MLVLTHCSACVACLGRLVYSVRIISTSDLTYAGAPLAMWGVAELTAVILCCCIPTFPRFFAFLRGKNRKTTAHSSRPSPNAGLSVMQLKRTARKPRDPYSLQDKTLDEELRPYTQLDGSMMVPDSAQDTSGSHEPSNESKTKDTEYSRRCKLQHAWYFTCRRIPK